MESKLLGLTVILVGLVCRARRIELPSSWLLVGFGVYLLYNRRRTEGFAAESQMPPVDLEAVKNFNRFAARMYANRNVAGDLNIDGKLTVNGVEITGNPDTQTMSVANLVAESVSAESLEASGDVRGQRVLVNGLILDQNSKSGGLNTPPLVVDNAIDDQTSARPGVISRNYVATAAFTEPISCRKHPQTGRDEHRYRMPLLKHYSNIMMQNYIPVHSRIFGPTPANLDNSPHRAGRTWSAIKFKNANYKYAEGTNPALRFTYTDPGYWIDKAVQDPCNY